MLLIIFIINVFFLITYIYNRVCVSDSVYACV